MILILHTNTTQGSAHFYPVLHWWRIQAETNVLLSAKHTYNITPNVVSQSVVMLKTKAWYGDWMTKWPNDLMTEWPNDQMTKWLNDQMTE